MSRALRVVHLISGDLWAGSEAATYHLVRALAERPDVLVRVVTLNPGELVERLRKASVEVTVEPEAGRGHLGLLRAVRPHLRDADIVHSHCYKENLIAALSGVPWVTTQHGRPEPSSGVAAMRSALYQGLDRVATRHSARRVIAVSTELGVWVAQRVGARRTVCVWNGIADPAVGLTLPGWPARPRRVGVLGRLFPVKGYELAVDAVAACRGVELEIVGEGPERAALERRIAASGAADRIRLLGHVPDPRGLLATWRALLVTSHHEGNPIGVLEALALGTPVVSARSRGVAEILDGQAGWIEQTRDPKAWAGRLARILEDEAEGTAASAAARRRYLAAFTAEVAAARTISVYRAALGFKDAQIAG